MRKNECVLTKNYWILMVFSREKTQKTRQFLDTGFTRTDTVLFGHEKAQKVF